MESVNKDDNYTFHFIESKEYFEFYKNFNSNEKDEILDILNPLSDDFDIEFRATPYLSINSNMRVGTAKKKLSISFSKKWKIDIPEISGNSPNFENLKLIGERYRTLGDDIGHIYSYVSRLMSITDYKREVSPDTNLNKILTSKYNLTIELTSEEFEIPEIRDLYFKYMKSHKVDPKIIKWHDDMMKTLKKELPDADILCHLVEEDEDYGHWDIYVYFKDEYYSLSTYWVREDKWSIHTKEINGLKKDMVKYGKS